MVKKQIPDISQIKNEDKEMKVIEKVYQKLSNPNHLVSIAMHKMQDIEEVKIIEGKAK